MTSARMENRPSFFLLYFCVVCTCACLHYLLDYLMKHAGRLSPITVYGNTAATK